MTNSIEIQLVGKNRHKKLIICTDDYERVSKFEWRLYGDYPHNEQVKTLHHFIMGPRGQDVPDDYVIDHADRNPLNATRSNLRWVSASFNAWNSAVSTGASSRFKGVYYDRPTKKWRAQFCRIYLGSFAHEKDAAKAVAKVAIIKWGNLALNSDLLIGDNLLTPEEILTIQKNIVNKVTDATDIGRVLPPGVYKYNNTAKYLVKVANKRVGVYETVELAEAAWKAASIADKLEQKAKAEQQWIDYTQVPITKDNDGNAFIALSGKHGQGKKTLVPSKLWHKLTYKKSWNFMDEYVHGHWQGKSIQLHRVVFELCHPNMTLQGKVDHINPGEKLNNLESNLRDASDSVQAYNKQKKNNCSSQHIGVYFEISSGKWRGSIRHEGKRFRIGSHITEQSAACALNQLAKQLKGEYARILVI